VFVRAASTITLHAGGTLTVAGIGMAVSAVDPATGTIEVQGHSIPVEIRDDDENILPQFGDVTGLAGPFSEAYILPLEDGGTDPANNQVQVVFLANGAEPALADASMRQDTPQFAERDSFWVAYLSTAYQWAIDRDNDPESESAISGFTRGAVSNTVVASGADASWVFLETMRDVTASAVPLDPGYVARVTVDELGHQMGLDHISGTIMSGDARVAPSDPGFDDVHLHLLRSRTQSPHSPVP